MAEKQCKACKMMIDVEAKICPHCRARQGTSLWKKIGIGFLILFAIGMLSNVFKEQKEAARKISFTPEQRAIEEKKARLNNARYACKEFLLKILSDPDSAKFDDYNTWYAREQKGKSILVQPTGRAKNAFGAYVYGIWNCVVINDGNNFRLISMDPVRPQ